MEIKHNMFIKYDPYFQHYPFIHHFYLKCKILTNQHLSDGRYDYFGDRVETMRHGVYGIMLAINQHSVLSIYEGSWGTDTYHGKGCLYTISHPSSKQPLLRKMEGQWSNGMLHGKGVIRHWNKEKNQWDITFQGNFTNGEKTGLGIEREQKTLYRGQFSKGCRTGRGRLQDEEGNFFDGTFEMGFLVGDSYQSVGDAFIITDSAQNRKIYRKPDNDEDFTQNFSQLIHQIVSGNMESNK